MEVRKWLEDVADRVPPDESDDRSFPDLLQPRQEEPTRLGRSYRRKRRRASSDSSLIAPRPTNHREDHAAIPSGSPDDVRAADDAATVLQSSESSRSAPAVPAKTYEKCARHKTRPDRYEPKQRKRRKERDVRKERKEKQKRRGSHRGGDCGRTAGLVQSFQLKNGPKNNRLTLRPNASAGLFKHGRASAPMMGRGGGLPDLVFNEMRFLQKPREHQDKAAEDERPQHESSKTDRKRPREEEISAYFSAQQRTKYIQANAGSRQPRNVDDGHDNVTSKSRPVKVSQIAPTIELPEKPFLGFGSKGGEPDNKNTPVESSAYYTWSESVPDGHSYARKRPLAAPSVNVGELSAKKRNGIRKRSAEDHNTQKEMRRRSRGSGGEGDGLQPGQWIQTRRTREPALVEMYQPPAASKHGDQQRCPSVTKTTSQSLPKHVPPAHHGNQIDHDKVTNIRQHHDTYHTSDILEIRNPPRSTGDRHESDQQYSGHNLQSEKENKDPQSTFSIDKVLGQVQEAISNPNFRLPSPSHRGRHVPKDFFDVGHLQMPEFQAEQRAQQVEPTESQHDRFQKRSRTAHTPQRERGSYSQSRRSSMRASAHQRMPALPPRAIDGRGLTTRHRRLPSVDQDDEMLDDLPNAGPLPVMDSHVYADGTQAAALVFGHPSMPHLPGMFEVQGHRSSEARMFSRSPVWQTLISRTPSIRGMSMEGKFQGDGGAGLQNDTFDDLAGFWKAHKLY